MGFWAFAHLLLYTSLTEGLTAPLGGEALDVTVYSHVLRHIHSHSRHGGPGGPPKVPRCNYCTGP